MWPFFTDKNSSVPDKFSYNTDMEINHTEKLNITIHITTLIHHLENKISGQWTGSYTAFQIHKLNILLRKFESLSTVNIIHYVDYLKEAKRLSFPFKSELPVLYKIVDDALKQRRCIQPPITNTMKCITA